MLLKPTSSKLLFKNIIFVIIFSLLIWLSFAQNTVLDPGLGGWTPSTFNINILLANLFEILNLVWLPFAILAWNLLTNKMIFGAGFWEQLFAMWASMKTFAFFTLAGIFLLMIFSYFFRSQGDALKKYLPKIVLAALAIPLSWFFLALLLDLSTIMMVAVGSFWSSVVGTQGSEETFKIPKKVVLVDSQKLGTVKMNWSSDGEPVTLKDILSDVNSLAGPLVSLGVSILQFPKINNSIPQTESWASINVELILKVVIVAMFVIPLALLIVVALMRIFYIWVYLIFAPFLVLDWVFNGPLSKKPYFQLSNVIGLIFQPVWIIAGMSLGLIFVNWMATVITRSWASISDKWSAILDTLGLKGSQMVFTTSQWTQGTIQWGMQLFDQTISFVWWIFGYLILWGVTIALLWALLKIAFATTQITKWVVDGSFNFIEGMAKATPVVPWVGWPVSVGALAQAPKKFKAFTTEKKISDDSTKVLDTFRKFVGLEWFGLNASDKNKLEQTIASWTWGHVYLTNFFKELQSIVKTKQNVPYNDPILQDILKKFVSRDQFRTWLLANPSVWNVLFSDMNVSKIKANINNLQEWEKVAPTLISDPKFQRFVAWWLYATPDFASPDQINSALQGLTSAGIGHSNLVEFAKGTRAPN